MKMLLPVFFSFMVTTTVAQRANFHAFTTEFVRAYEQLHIPQVEYDYRDYLAAIQSVEQLQQQQVFFLDRQKALALYNRMQLSKPDQTIYDHLDYEISFNLERLALEKEWRATTLSIPNEGLKKLPSSAHWYSWFVKRFTTTEITPEEVYAYGLREVQRVKDSISAIQLRLGFSDNAAFYAHLNEAGFFVTDKQQLLSAFEQIDKTVRKNLHSFIGTDTVPPIYAMEWPGATAQTPPGMYLNRRDNAYGKDVFQFNFYNGRYNSRAMEWLYMHEAIPGHHLQFSFRTTENELQNLFFYPGNFEAWACYIEYFGKETGLYTDPYMYLGKWEWDLVRSARLVIDAGIHYYGWTREQALTYWKQNIPNQDEIAEREVTRVTNWPCQALSYKIGAMKLFKLQADWQKKNPSKPLSSFFRTFLAFGNLPLTVIEKNIEEV